MKIGDIVRTHPDVNGIGRWEDCVIKKIEGDQVTIALARSPIVKQKLLYWKIVNKDGVKPRRFKGIWIWPEP
jgi:hypothetical protein